MTGAVLGFVSGFVAGFLVRHPLVIVVALLTAPLIFLLDTSVFGETDLLSVGLSVGVPAAVGAALGVALRSRRARRGERTGS